MNPYFRRHIGLRETMNKITSQSLRYFELISFTQLVLGAIASMVFDHKAMVDMAKSSGLGDSFIIIVGSITFFVMTVMILLISRKKSKIAKWVWVTLFVLGLPSYISHLTKMLPVSFAEGIFYLVQFLLSCAAIYFLFRSDARQAFKKQQ